MIRAFSIVFVVIGLGFSPYILYRYGLSSGPIHDRAGHVIGQVNYFFFSLAFSVFWVGVSLFCYWAAQRALIDLNKKKQTGAD